MDASALAALLAWGALKGALLLAAAGAATTALRQAPAAARHAVWAGALGAALVLPALDAFVPTWRVAVLPAAPAATTHATGAPGGSGLDFPAVLVAVWLAGVVVVSARWIAAALAARRLVAHSRPMNDESWRYDVARIGRQLGLTRAPTLRTNAALLSPVAWGVRRPALILPEGADKWSAERREAVLVHELAHVRRRDCLTGLVAEAACALHWFDPLAWLAYRRLHVERERACDDGVLQSGMLASRYASHLLEVARAAGRGRELRAARLTPALARRTEIEERIRAMLDGRPRGGPLSRAAVWVLSAATLAAAGVLGAVEPVRRPSATVILAQVAPRPPVALAAAATEIRTEARFDIAPPPAPDPPARHPRPGRAAPVPPDAAAPLPPVPPVPSLTGAPSEIRYAASLGTSPSTTYSSRVISWRAPSGPMASDEPPRVTRVVRVARGPGGQHFVFVMPEFPAGVWRERTDEVRIIMERSYAREVEVRARLAERAALGVHAERVVASANRTEKPGAVCVDSAAHEVYRARRVEESPRGKRGA